MRKAWTAVDEQRLLQMRRSGETIKECAAALGRTFGAIADRLRLRGWTFQVQDAKGHASIVRRLHRLGRSNHEIHVITGLSRTQIAVIKRRLGLRMDRENLSRVLRNGGTKKSEKAKAAAVGAGWPPVRRSAVRVLEAMEGFGYEGVSTVDIAARIGCTSTRAWQVLTDLVRSGHVLRRGTGSSNFRYEIAPHVLKRRQEVLRYRSAEVPA